MKTSARFAVALPAVLLISLGLYSSRPANPAPPEENRFTKVVLAEKLNEPLEMAILPDERVLFVERHGQVRCTRLPQSSLKPLLRIPVSTKYKDKEGNETEAEDGLLGVNIDPNFTPKTTGFTSTTPRRATTLRTS